VIGGRIVADAVVHPYNLAPENQDPTAGAQLETVFGAHEISMDDAHAEYRMRREEFFTDVSFETIARSLFVEAQVDFAVIHSLPNLGFARDYQTDPRRAAAFRDLHPDRFRVYATVDTPVTDTAIEQLRRQVEELGVDGLKLYPAFFYDGKGEGWRLDGEDFAVPLLEAAYDMGIRRVAIHKALWLPPAPREAFAVDDMAGALERFPDITFSIVHAGAAFRDETVELMRTHDNLYATLESTFAYLLFKPETFADVLGAMVTTCGSERMLFASGTNLLHPRPLIEAFADYELPAQLLEERGYRQLTEQDRRNILGENLLGMHDLTPADIEAREPDAYDAARAEGLAPPWSNIR
jgi:predicted TIM-barrel fold metal-dependent hydrolase